MPAKRKPAKSPLPSSRITRKPPTAPKSAPKTKEPKRNIYDIDVSVERDRISIRELKSKIYDLDVPDDEIRKYFTINEGLSDAFAPVVEVNPSLVETDGEEAAVGLSVFNGLSRWRRQQKYRRKIRDGYQGLKIVSEGDSWFQYPWILDDVIDQLFDEYAIMSLGAAGDTLGEMIIKDEFLPFIQQENPQVFLISGGGNDVFGNGKLSALVNPNGSAETGFLNAEFDQLIRNLIKQYRTLFDRLGQMFPNLRILCHGYDYAIPNDGPWLGKPLASVGIVDRETQSQILRQIVDRFFDAFRNAAADFPNALVVDCRSAVAPKLWHDELHPTNLGFKAVADRFRNIISALEPTRSRLPKARPRACPGREAIVEGARELSGELNRRLVARRGRSLGIIFNDDAAKVSDDASKAVEVGISNKFEKIDQGADFLPARFLDDGSRRSNAVCRIHTPTSLGTGFLIASRQFIMTNNHVITTATEAENCVAEFGFQAGSTPTMVALRADQFFVTDEQLDFTIVACDEAAVAQHVTPIELLRSPSTITRNELVNIIQHPRGRLKEVTLHNNEVSDVLDKVIRYRTDTEPGSSGSPVFNNGWDLVALHHAGWIEGDGRATNEGIRISAIVAKLLSMERESASNESLNEVLSLVPDTSPYLGFFDIAGVADTPNEIEIPDFRGTPDFADVGFWNIERFNRHIGSVRIDRVAEVVDRMSMDVLGLTEVEHEAMVELRKALRAKGNDVDFVMKDVSGNQDMAVLYDRDTTEVVEASAIADRNRELLQVETPSGRKAFPREPLFARCKVMDEASTHAVEFIIIVVHLKAFGDASSRARRRLAATCLAQIIEDIRANERLPVVLGGDFNEAINTDVLSALTNVPDLVSLTTNDADAGAASYIGGSRRSLIDHIIVSSDIRPGLIQGDDAAILRLDRSVGDFSSEVSDHVPVLMRIVTRSAPIDVGNGDHDTKAVTGVIQDGHAKIQLLEEASLLTVQLANKEITDREGRV